MYRVSTCKGGGEGVQGCARGCERGCKGAGAHRVKTARASLLISLVLASESEVQFCTAEGGGVEVGVGEAVISGSWGVARGGGGGGGWRVAARLQLDECLGALAVEARVEGGERDEGVDLLDRDDALVLAQPQRRAHRLLRQGRAGVGGKGSGWDWG